MIPLDITNLGEMRQIPSFPDYAVFSTGVVVKCYRGIPIREIGNKTEANYTRVSLAPGLNPDPKDIQMFKQALVHRIVAQIFISNPEAHTEVQHIDGDRQNNRVENLRWVARHTGCKQAQEHKGDWLAPYRGTGAKAVRRVDPMDFSVVTYRSSAEAAKVIGNAASTNTIRSAARSSSYAYGYFWSWATDPELEVVEKLKIKLNYTPTLANVLPSPV